MTIEAVLFDIDDTLLDYGGAGFAGLRAQLLGEHPALDVAGFEGAWDEWLRLEAAHYPEYLSGEVSLAEQRRRRTAGLLRHLGLPPRGRAELTNWYEKYLGHYEHHWRAFDDVAETLDALASRAAGVITNAELEPQRRKLEALGLSERLPLVIASGAVGVAKPDARIFAITCERLGRKPAEVAYVGDRLTTDARGARDAGMLGIWLDRRGLDPSVDDVPRITGLGQLTAALS